METSPPTDHCGHCKEPTNKYNCIPDPKHEGYWLCGNPKAERISKRPSNWDSDEDAIFDGFDTYQELAHQTAIYPEQYKILYPLIGLAGEAGEMLNKFKKVLRDGTDVPVEQLLKELGDCQWYIALIAYDLEESLGNVANENIKKLKDRQNRGVLGGSGDTR